MKGLVSRNNMALGALSSLGLVDYYLCFTFMFYCVSGNPNTVDGAVQVQDSV